MKATELSFGTFNRATEVTHDRGPHHRCTYTIRFEPTESDLEEIRETFDCSNDLVDGAIYQSLLEDWFIYLRELGGIPSERFVVSCKQGPQLKDGWTVIVTELP